MAELETVIAASLESAGLTGQSDDADGVVVDDSGSDGTADTQAAADPAPTGDAGAPEAPAAEGDPAPAADKPASDAAAAATTEAPAKRPGRIPFEKHEKILTNEREKHKAEITALNQRYEAVKWAEHPEAKARVAAMDAAETRPELFVSALLSDEKLGPLFRKALQAEAPAAAATPPPATQNTSPVGERPGPNVKDKDGNLGYDQAGLDALLDWTARDAAARATGIVEKKFEEKFGRLDPVLKQHEATESWNRDVAAADRAIKQARDEWEGFKDNEGDIKKFLTDPANSRKTLWQAYQAVVIPKFKADRTKMREDIMAELGKKASVSAPRPAATTPAATGGTRDLEDVIKDSIAHLQ
jgi:hypothetical protein